MWNWIFHKFGLNLKRPKSSMLLGLIDLKGLDIYFTGSFPLYPFSPSRFLFGLNHYHQIDYMFKCQPIRKIVNLAINLFS